jgi:hypothetical protein
MAPATLTAQIHFHQQNEVSVFFENNIPDKHTEMVGEIHLFVLFALRQMSNLGTAGDSLAEMLTTAAHAIESLAGGYEVGGVRLIRYPGTPGMKQFLLTAQILSNQHVHFDVKAKGFGFLWRGMGYYSPVAVQTLLRFLAIRRANSPKYLSWLAQAAAACGAAQLGRKISVANHTPLSFSIVGPIAALAIEDRNVEELSPMPPEIQKIRLAAKINEDRDARKQQPEIAPSSTPAPRPGQDADLTTKRERWKAAETEAKKRVRDALAAFVSNRFSSSPSQQLQILKARNRIYVNHTGVAMMLSGILEQPCPYKDQLYSLSLDEYLRLACSSHVLAEAIWLSRPREQDRDWPSLMFDGIAETYKCPPDYANGWLRAINDCRADEMLLAMKAYSEIATVLNLSPDDTSEASRWMKISAPLANFSNDLCEDRSWLKSVNDEFPEHEGHFTTSSKLRTVNWEEKNRRAIEQRQFYIPGTDDALIVGVAECEPPHLKKPGSRWLLIHAQSALRLSAFNAIKGWAIGQVAFFANWLYRQFPCDHWVWTETHPDKVRVCLEPVVEKGLDTRDWSEYRTPARDFGIKEESARLSLLILDYGISDHPDDEESEDIRKVSELQRASYKELGHPRPGMGYEDGPYQDKKLLEMRVVYCITKYGG